MLFGTVTMPYGLTSPFAGTVVAIAGGFGMNGPMNGAACAVAAPSVNHPHRHTSVGRTARLPAAASRARAATARGCELGG